MLEFFGVRLRTWRLTIVESQARAAMSFHSLLTMSGEVAWESSAQVPKSSVCISVDTRGSQQSNTWSVFCTLWCQGSRVANKPKKACFSENSIVYCQDLSEWLFSRHLKMHLSLLDMSGR